GFPSLCGDATALPCRAGAFDAAVAAFSFTHLEDPAAGLREAATAVVPGGPLIVSGFGPDPHPLRTAVDAAAARFGWDPPDWYAGLRAAMESFGTGEAMRDAARAAGLAEVSVATITVDVGPVPPAALVAYRLGKVQLAAFVASLSPGVRAQLVD